MRYTTIIDIREFPLYRNPAVRQLYLHMVLAAGFHESDMDQVAISIRGLATQTGLTISATRHALAVLVKAGLVRRQSGQLHVAKYILQEGIPKRARSKKDQQLQQQARERENQEQAKRRKEIEEQNQLIRKYFTLEDLEELLQLTKSQRPGQFCYYKAAKVVNNESGIKYIQSWIEYKKKQANDQSKSNQPKGV